MASEGFTYLYTAGDQAQDDALRRRYGLPYDAEVNSEIKKAPARERQESLRLSVMLGTVCMLAFGGGLAAILTGVGPWVYAFGILLGTSGMTGMVLMPGIYRRIAEKKRRKNEILFAAR